MSLNLPSKTNPLRLSKGGVDSGHLCPDIDHKGYAYRDFFKSSQYVLHGYRSVLGTPQASRLSASDSSEGSPLMGDSSPAATALKPTNKKSGYAGYYRSTRSSIKSEESEIPPESPSAGRIKSSPNPYLSDDDDHDPNDPDRMADAADSTLPLGDWNQRFQSIAEALRAFDAYTPLSERVETNRKLIHLAQDFVYSSATYGKIIISEACVPHEEKTIRPRKDFGGVIGGDKYVVQNIMFKFAVDTRGLYGSSEAASKVAGHELKGLISHFSCGTQISLPLMALVDFRGFRLIAMSVLPISRPTIIYGSNNCGHVVYPGTPRWNEELTAAALRLNITSHMGGVNKHFSAEVHGPVDMEGHIGSDNRFYLIDFSRLMPPQTPQRHVKMGHLFQLLRPEFVRSHHTPLCSDGFSGFVKDQPGEEKANRDLVRATNELLKMVIPEFAKDFSETIFRAVEKGNLTLVSQRLTEVVHRRGINMRFLGVVRHHITGIDCKALLMVEMLARVIKYKLRSKLRQKMEELRLPVDEPYRRLIINYLNLVFGESEASETHWLLGLKPLIRKKFIRALSPEEESPSFSLKEILSQFSHTAIDGKYLLFSRIQAMSGLKFSSRLNKELVESPNNWAPRGQQPFDDTDLKTIECRVKHMNIVTHAQGYLYKIEGLRRWARDPVAASRFFELAMINLHEALATNPGNTQTLSDCAEVFALLIESEYHNVANVKLFVDHPRVQQANEYFMRALEANPHSADTHFLYAQFLEKCHEFSKAEDYYLRALEIDPNHVDALQEYGNFLTDLGSHHDAEEFYKRCSAATLLYTETVEKIKALRRSDASSLSNSDMLSTSLSSGSDSDSDSDSDSSFPDHNASYELVNPYSVETLPSGYENSSGPAEDELDQSPLDPSQSPARYNLRNRRRQ